MTRAGGPPKPRGGSIAAKPLPRGEHVLTDKLSAQRLDVGAGEAGFEMDNVAGNQVPDPMLAFALDEGRGHSL